MEVKMDANRDEELEERTELDAKACDGGTTLPATIAEAGPGCEDQDPAKNVGSKALIKPAEKLKENEHKALGGRAAGHNIDGEGAQLYGEAPQTVDEPLPAGSESDQSFSKCATGSTQILETKTPKLGVGDEGRTEDSAAEPKEESGGASTGAATVVTMRGHQKLQKVEMMAAASDMYGSIGSVAMGASISSD